MVLVHRPRLRAADRQALAMLLSKPIMSGCQTRSLRNAVELQLYHRQAILRKLLGHQLVTLYKSAKKSTASTSPSRKREECSPLPSTHQTRQLLPPSSSQLKTIQISPQLEWRVEPTRHRITAGLTLVTPQETSLKMVQASLSSTRKRMASWEELESPRKFRSFTIQRPCLLGVSPMAAKLWSWVARRQQGKPLRQSKRPAGQTLRAKVEVAGQEWCSWVSSTKRLCPMVAKVQMASQELRQHTARTTHVAIWTLQMSPMKD